MDAARSLEEQKARFRKQLRYKLNQLKPVERRQRSRKILARLFKHPSFLKARSILTYVAVDSEVQTYPVLKMVPKMGKRIYVPVIDLKKNQMRMIEVTDGKKLRPGAYGVPEPALRGNRIGNPKELDLAIVPGLGFDQRRIRLGRGKGYFDRFLKKASKAYKMGLAFQCQVVKKLPCDKHDVMMDEVLIG